MPSIECLEIMNNWKKIFSNKEAYRANIVKSVLENAGITTILINKNDSAYNGAFGGECEILVNQEDVIRAIKIIQDEVRFE